MCIILSIPQNVAAPSNEILYRCWAGNNDGVGFMYVDDNDPTKPKIKIHKYKTFTNFLFGFKKKFDEWGKRGPFIIHFRDSNRGAVSMDNVHPFYIGNGVAFCHNGTIDNTWMDKEITVDGMSDSRKFNEFILKELPPRWWDNKKVLDLIKSYVFPSRLCFLTTEKEVIYVNNTQQGALWNGGIWYSTTIPVIRGKMIYKKNIGMSSNPTDYTCNEFAYMHEPETTEEKTETKDEIDDGLIMLSQVPSFSRCDGCECTKETFHVQYGATRYHLCKECQEDPETAVNNFWDSRYGPFSGHYGSC